MPEQLAFLSSHPLTEQRIDNAKAKAQELGTPCLLYTSDAADERSSVDLGGRRIIKKKTSTRHVHSTDKEQQRPYTYTRDTVEITITEHKKVKRT